MNKGAKPIGTANLTEGTIVALSIWDKDVHREDAAMAFYLSVHAGMEPKSCQLSQGPQADSVP